MVLYVSKRFDTSIIAQAHLKAIKELAGEDNVFVADLRLVKGFSEKNYIAFGRYKNTFELACRLLEGNSSYISNKIIGRICAIVKEKGIDTVFIEDSMFGNLAKRLKRCFPKIRIITFFHDIGVDLYSQWKLQSKSLVGRLECDILIRQEALQVKYSDVNMVFNSRDAALCKKHFGFEPDCIVPLSWDAPRHTEEYMSAESRGGKKKLLFVGAKYWPNIVGIKWFYENVLHKLDFDFELVTVGRGTEILKKDLTDSRVNIVGGVEDLGEYYREADIVILPLFDGGGMKTKTVEALAFGKTLVGTKEGFEGYWERLSDTVKSDFAFKSDDAESWISTLNSLGKKELRPFNQAVYSDFVSHFSYEAMFKEFEKIFK